MAENWDGIKNCDVGPCEVYVNKQYLGPTEGNVTLELPFDSFPVEYGIPATSMGDIITRINGTLTFNCLFAKPENIALCGGKLVTDETGEYMTSGTEILMPTVSNVVLHHENKLTGKHLIIGIWKMQSTAPIRWEFVSANPSKVMTVDLSFKLLATDDPTWKTKSPLCVVYFNCDSFDINNLPWSGSPGPEPPAPSEHEVTNEEVTLSNHAGALAHGKVSAYTIKNNAGEVTLVEGTDYSIDTQTGEITMLDGSEYYSTNDVKASYTWWDNRTAISEEEVTSVDAGGGNYRYSLAHSPIENASTLEVTSQDGLSEFVLGEDYNCNYNSGELFSISESAMAAASYTIKASYYYYSNNA